MARKKQGRKHDELQEIDGEHEMDDMAIAAQFAALTYPTTTSLPPAPPPPKPPTSDNNEIELDEEEEEAENDAVVTSEKEKWALNGDEPTVGSSEESDGEELNTKNNNQQQDDDDDDDDDDSHIDMSAELAELERMEQTSGDNSAPPKTENELDPYHTPLSEIEKKFHLKLTMEDDTDKYTPDTVKLGEAGTVKNHMVQDRTIIVESFHREGSSAPLDEGSLLVFQMTTPNDNTISLIPMGKIFEVFGPVRKALYTIRLPSPSEMKARQTPSNTSNNEVVKEQEDSKKDKVEPGAESTSSEAKTSTGPLENDKPTVPASSDALSTNKQEDSVKNTSQEKDVVPITKDEGTTEPQKVDDHWSKDGKYTRFLQENPDLTVFYVQDEAKTIDAQAILRLSAKGCDASNVYDEEVVNVNEMYFSDDEEERDLKRKGKARKQNNINNDDARGGNRQSNQRPNRGRGGFHQMGGPVPSGFHHQAQPPQYPPHPMGYPHAQQQQWPHHQPMAYGVGAPPPPPPPPGVPHPYQVYPPHQVYPPAGYPVPQYAPAGFAQGYVQQAPYRTGVVPPPPSYPNPNANHSYPQQAAPPHNQTQQSSGQQQQQQQQQQSDTIYYDYT